MLFCTARFTDSRARASPRNAKSAGVVPLEGTSVVNITAAGGAAPGPLRRWRR
jgi:hypothetical protein